MGLLVGAHFYLKKRERAGWFFAGPTALSDTEDPIRILLEMYGWYFLLRSNSSRFLNSNATIPGRGRSAARGARNAGCGDMDL